MSKISIFWFRRDLRLEDNAGLYHALKGEHPVLPLFIFDKNILDKLPKSDARVEFIHREINRLKKELEEKGSSLLIKYGNPLEVWKELMNEYEIAAVYTNRDYEPYAKDRDAKVKELLSGKDISFHTFKDHVIFEKDEVLKDDGDPYVVFTPYSRKWKERRHADKVEVNGKMRNGDFFFKSYPTLKYEKQFHKCKPLDSIALEDMGFEKTEISFPDKTVQQKVIKEYDEKRDFPAIDGTSRLGIHFRFGTISIREKARKAEKLNGTFLNELIWRDFYSMILDHFPYVVDGPFRKEYGNIQWRNNEKEFEKWCQGKTGYPIVDAGMRELNHTGYMHNRVRMVVASFLSKHLLINWQWGEAYFAEKLLDFDLASNSGGWQWAAGCGTDAAPYFRIFNPESQLKKFDKDGKYVKKWVPEWQTEKYPEPIVDHKAARERCLETYKEALASK
ncbi:MAG: deoxyribodipyrimidine photo-lyase [Saprospiraceae bacterium]|nr:deoxyribodipyrimidine photo-lyase [Saprospiraceae bacterium]